VAVDTGKGQALVVAQGLAPTQDALVRLGSVLAVPISTGSALTVAAIVGMLAERRRRRFPEM
jgi:hypothetical protein